MDPSTEAQDVLRCELCKAVVAKMHCDFCFVNLCNACVGDHFSADISKPHKIVDILKRKSTLIYPECSTHDNETCEIYCHQCDIPICTTCVASDLHAGHKFCKVSKVLDDRKEKIIIEKNRLHQAILPTYQNIVSDVENTISQLEKKYEDLSKAITMSGVYWHKEIDKLVNKLNGEVDEMKKSQLQILQKHLDEIKKTFILIKDEDASIDAVLHSTNILNVLNYSSKLGKYENLPQKLVIFTPSFIHRNIHNDQQYRLNPGSLTSEYSYSIKRTHNEADSESCSQKLSGGGSLAPGKQMLDTPVALTTIDTGYHRLYSLSCLSDDKIWASGENAIIKLFSTTQGSPLKSITTTSAHKPIDLAVTNCGDLAYIDGIHKTVNILSSGGKEELRIHLPQDSIPLGVCSTFSGDILVIMNNESRVVRYSGSIEKQSFQSDDNERPLYSRSDKKFISENRNLDICVADNGAKAVVVVNQAGKLKFRYTGHTPAPKEQSFSPLGITTDSQSHILTVDYDNHCVHIINQNGQFLRYIDCGLRYPWVLCIDTKDNLFVDLDNRRVRKIKYQQ